MNIRDLAEQLQADLIESQRKNLRKFEPDLN
jgi:hypothetical protein